MIHKLKRQAIRYARRLGYQVERYPTVNSLPWTVRHLLSRLAIDCVLDVGARHGEYAGMLRQIGYRGRIVSFEPVPENFAILRRKCADDSRWTAFPWALGAAEAVLPMNVTEGTNFSSFLTPNAYAAERFGPAATVNRTEAVEVKRLDALLDAGVIGADASALFLKVDTQGFDREVITGAGAWIHQMRGVQTEVSVQPLYEGMTGFAEFLEWLRTFGFDLSGLFPIVFDDVGRVIEFDCLVHRAEFFGSRSLTSAAEP